MTTNNPKPKKSKMANHFSKVGNRALFYLGIELFYDDILKAFRGWLQPLTPEKVKEMIRKGELPQLDPEWFTKIEGWKQYILEIKIGKVAQAIGDARPDLGKAILECGADGGVWLNRLYVYLLECVDHPERVKPIAAQSNEPVVKMVNVRCQSCGKGWPIKEADVAKLEKCPFCGAAAKDEAKKE
jgi:hypothetical protein